MTAPLRRIHAMVWLVLLPTLIAALLLIVLATRRTPDERTGVPAGAGSAEGSAERSAGSTVEQRR